MAKTIGVMLKLKDGFSKGFKGFRDQTKETKREVNRLKGSVKKFSEDAGKSLIKLTKSGIGAIGALASVSAKVGLSEAMDLQGYRMQLETATKDTRKAATIMQDTVKLANKTPFEAGELVQGAAMFEAMGMSAQKWLPLTGDMAAATNKSFEQATEALIDAQTGELERLKEFGLTKAMIADKADKMFAGQQVVNNKGQIVNQEKFNEAMMALMQEKFAGGMAKQANTIKGIWSTVTGITKSGLATLLGMTETGEVRENSALDFLSGKLQLLAQTFEQWQQDGTIQKWASEFDRMFAKTVEVATPIIKGLGTGLSFLAKNFDVLVPIIIGAKVGFSSMGIAKTAANGIKTFGAAIKLMNGMLKASPLFIIPNIIGVLTSILHHFDITWSDVFNGAIDWVTKTWSRITGWVDYMKNVKVPGFIKKVKSYIAAAADSVKTLWDKFVGFIGWLKNVKLPGWIGSLGNHLSDAASALGGGKKKKKKKRNATGTPYFAGGLTSINEGGRGETVVLPSGTQIIPHDVAKKQPVPGSNSSVTVNVHIAGNVIGNRDFAQYVGNVVSKQVLKAVANT